MHIKTRRVIWNGPVFAIIYGFFTFLFFIIVSFLFNGMRTFEDIGSSIIIPLTLAMTGVYLIATVIQVYWQNPITRFLAVISEIWKGSLVYFVIFGFPIFIIDLFVNIPKEITIILLFVIAPIIIIYSIYNAHNIRTKHISLSFKNLKKPLRIILFSDVHMGSIRGKRLLNNIVAEINNPDNGKIDFVVISGDLADGSAMIDSKSFEILAKSKVSMFFTPGNHDFYPGLDTVIAAADNANITTLYNTMTEYDGVQIIGIPFSQHRFENEWPGSDHEAISEHIDNNEDIIDNINDSSNRFNKDDFNFNEIDHNKLSILLHHSPVGWDFFKDKGVDLVLSGHTHGGQLFPFNYIIKKFYPYLRGLFEDNGKYMYVSDGVGTFTPPLRLGTIAEMTIIDLKKKD